MDAETIAYFMMALLGAFTAGAVCALLGVARGLDSDPLRDAANNLIPRVDVLVMQLENRERVRVRRATKADAAPPEDPPYVSGGPLPSVLPPGDPMT